MAPASTHEEDFEISNGNFPKEEKNGSTMDSSQKKQKKQARHGAQNRTAEEDEATRSRKRKNTISKEHKEEEEETPVKKKMVLLHEDFEVVEEEENNHVVSKVISKKKTKRKLDGSAGEVNSEGKEDVTGKRRKKKKTKKEKMEEDEEEKEQQESSLVEGRPWTVFFQLVVPSKDVGKVIGKQGLRVQQLRENSGAQIKIEDPIVNTGERVIWISSKEETLDSQSAAERALLNVAKLLMKAENGDKEVAKLCLRVSRPDSEVVRELQVSAERVVRVLTKGAHRYRYVEIEGEIGMVRRDLELIAVKLRERRGHAESRKRKQGKIRGPFKASAQIRISKGLVGALVGKEGTTILGLKHQSGALIEVKDPEDGAKKSIIHVKGTLAQVTRAQTLLQSFLASTIKLKK